jgi:hypothetical protein
MQDRFFTNSSHPNPFDLAKQAGSEPVSSTWMNKHPGGSAHSGITEVSLLFIGIPDGKPLTCGRPIRPHDDDS